jgi:two-component system, LytTR family, sensor kinase
MYTNCMNRRKIYWLCQIIGWTGYSLSDLILYILRDGYNYGQGINALITIGLGIGITHVYRLVIKRLDWFRLPLAQIIPRTLAAVLVMSVVMVVLSVPLEYFTIPRVQRRFDEIGGVPVIFIAWGFLNWTKNLLLWSVIYHISR